MSNRLPFALCFTFFLLVMAGMLWTEKKAGCGNIIIPLELAPDIQSFKALLVDACNLDWIERNTKLDFVFLAAYTLTIVFALRGLLTEASKLWLQLCTALAIMPGIFDTIENIQLIRFLRAGASTVTAGEFALYYWCVHLKFAILAFLLITITILAIRRLVGTFSN